MKKIVQDYFPEGKWGRMFSLTRLALVALVCSVGALAAAPVVSSAPQEAAQSARRTVTGIVTDQDGNPVVGANVTVQNVIGVGTITDARGAYSLSVARGATLEFSFVGMTDRTVQVGDQRTIDVRMQEESLVTGDVVVIAGISRPREAFTGDARIISGDQIRELGAGSVVTALRNADPSFYMAENNLMGSNPNALPIVTMRGSTSMPMVDGTMNLDNIDQAMEYSYLSNAPLLLIDGFISEFSRLSELDENLIESIVVMKDASATAMYGTRASNGIIDVITKRPEKGELRLTYTGVGSIGIPDLSSYNLMNAAQKLEYEVAAGFYSRSNISWYEGLALQRLYRMKKIDIDRGVDTYWMKYPLRTAVGHSHSLVIGGGQDDFLYSANIYYKSDPGVMKKSSKDIFRGSMRFEYIKKTFNFRNELEVQITKGYDSPYGADGAFKNYSRKNQYYLPYDEDGLLKKKLHDYDWAPYGVQAENEWIKDGRDNNPLFDAMQPQRHDRSSLMITDRFGFEWRAKPFLVFRGNMSASTTRDRRDDYYSRDMMSFVDNVPADKASYRGSYSLGMSESSRFDARLSAQFTKTFNDKHLVDLGLSGTLSQSKSENYTFMAYGISNPQDAFYGSATHLVNHNDDGAPNGYDAITRTAGGGFNVAYVYDERYMFNGTYNIDGSSLFGENNVYSPNWNVGAAWTLSKENFFDFDKVNYAVIKTNYGVTASQNFRAHMSKTMFQASDRPYGSWGTSVLTGIGNPDLKWEKTYQFGITTEWDLFDNRLNVVLSYYDRRTHDIVSRVNLPSAAGFPVYYANIGKAKNVGAEIIINGAVIRDQDRDLRWNLMFTAGHNKNVLLEISDGLSDMNAALLNRMNEGFGPATQFIEGEDRDAMWVKQSLGIDPMNGKEVFVDNDGNITYDWAAAKLVNAGSTRPDIAGNLNSMLEWKGWSLTLSFRYDFGTVAYMDMLANKVEGDDPFSNMDLRALEGRWMAVGQRAQYKSVKAWSSAERLTRATTRFVGKNNWVELTAVNLSYVVPASWASKNLGLSSLKLTGSMRDGVRLVETIKRERGIDYPFARYFNLSVNARF